jgi:hypothetical protein
MRRLSVLVAIAVMLLESSSPLCAQTVTVTVSPAQAVTGSYDGSGPAGEAQSTVIRPNLLEGCPQGRILISRDSLRPPLQGASSLPIVIGRDLNAPSDGSQDVLSTFTPADEPYYAYGSNDHDLVSDQHGTVYYAIGAFSKAPLANQPLWWSQTFRNSFPAPATPSPSLRQLIPTEDAFGPGARTNLMLWRSVDCGRTFTYASQFDPATLRDGSCAYPQFPRDVNYNQILTGLPRPAPGTLLSPTAVQQWDMGGSDGQLVKAIGNTLYLTFQCVGYEPSKTSPWFLSTTPLNITLIASSTDGGNSWQKIATFPQASWRMGVTTAPEWSVYPNNFFLTMGLYDGFAVGRTDQQPPHQLYINPNLQSFEAAPPYGGWVRQTPSPIASVMTNLIRVAVAVHAVSGRSGNGVDILAPDTLDGVDLLRHYRYDVPHRILTEGAQMSPNEAGGFPLHPLADECNDNTLFVWTDVNPANNTATVMGFLPFANAPFPIGTSMYVGMNGNGTFRQFSLLGAGWYWYGDYQTAGCYEQNDTEAGIDRRTYHFFPTWIEPDGNVHFAEVVYKPLPEYVGQTQDILVHMRAGLPAGARLLTGSTVRPLHFVPASSLIAHPRPAIDWLERRDP